MMSASEGQLPQSYTPEEIQQILHLAIARQSNSGELSREQLWEIAAELDIDQQSLQAAELDWLNQKALDRKRQEFDRYQRDRFNQKTVRYVIVNIFLVSLNVVSAGTITWSAFILLLWGLKLTLDAWATFQPKGESYEQAFQRWYLKNEVKQSLTSLWYKLKKFWQS